MNEDLTGRASRGELVRMAVAVARAYVSKNALPSGQLPEVIRTVFASLSDIQNGGPGAKPDAGRPAVPIKKSVTPDYIVCLEDGKRLKMLKRHLRTAYNLTPEQYRAKWSLGPDYPMVAPNYSARRSAFAKQIGLGRKPGNWRAARARIASVL